MYAPGYGEPVPPMVSILTGGWSLLSRGVAGSLPAVGIFEASNRGIWIPIWVPSVCVAYRMWWANGSTVTGNVEAGIYLDGGNKPGAKLITTGSVAQSGSGVIQFSDITDTTLTPGRYWLYLSASTTSADYLRTLTDTAWSKLVRMEQAGIGPGSAPATATPVQSTYTALYVFGFATTASP